MTDADKSDVFFKKLNKNNLGVLEIEMLELDKKKLPGPILSNFVFHSEERKETSSSSSSSSDSDSDSDLDL